MKELITNPEFEDLERERSFKNKLQFMGLVGDNLERSIRNSIDIKFLIQQEKDGIGHMTISDTLDVIQDLHSSGQIDIFTDITLRRKPVNPNFNEQLIKENAEYRKVLNNLMRQFSKKSKGYQVYAEAIRILLNRIDNKDFSQ